MSVKSSTELMLYVVLTMPTLNKAYLLFIYLCLCVDMRARYLNRSAMRMYEFCYFLFLARENLKMIKRNFTYGFD